MRIRIVVAVLALGLGVVSAPPAEAAGLARPFDFNGDGYAELVVSAPGLRVGSVPRAGGVVVLPASSAGLSLTERIVSQSSRGVPGASEKDDRFGSAVASADFDRDGYADLAVGQPGEADGTRESMGAVTLIYGSSRGLDTSRSRGIGPTSDTNDAPYGVAFGTALVAGDFNGDSFPDLAVGAPQADRDESPVDGNVALTGTVTVLSGGLRGLSTASPVVLRRHKGLDTDADTGFGHELAAGDLNQDGVVDLVVASQGEPWYEAPHPGSISYCTGRMGGPTGCTRLVHGRDYAGASSLAVGNMSGDARPEIVVGLPEPYGPLVPDDYDDRNGDVRILQLRAGTPLTVARQLDLRQSSAGIPGSHEPKDFFGSSVALGDIDRDGYADLAIGAAGENDSEGRVTVVQGAAAGWRTSGNYLYDQDTPGIPGVREHGDQFGVAVTLLDHNRDGRLDLTVGAFGENDFSGAITTLRGSGTRFTTAGARTFGLATLGYAHPADASFGRALGK